MSEPTDNDRAKVHAAQDALDAARAAMNARLRDYAAAAVGDGKDVALLLMSCAVRADQFACALRDLGHELMLANATLAQKREP